MLRTGIPFDVWAGQELETIATAVELLEEQHQNGGGDQ